METLRPEPIAKEVILVKRLVPTEFREVESLVPIGFDVHAGKLIPIEFKLVKKYIPVKFVTIEEPILIPKRQNSIPKRF
ncbi:MAG: hypothetical protein NTV24_05000 [Candidatus Woesebacteria bacterium]|nr:hypothetical protein [Candidatus Woesebacteria bacterium]